MSWNILSQTTVTARPLREKTASLEPSHHRNDGVLLVVTEDGLTTMNWFCAYLVKVCGQQRPSGQRVGIDAARGWSGQDTAGAGEQTCAHCVRMTLHLQRNFQVKIPFEKRMPKQIRDETHEKCDSKIVKVSKILPKKG